MIKDILAIFSEVDMIEGLLQTLYMICVSAIISYILGMSIGIFTVLTDCNGILKNKFCHKILNVIINIGRSIPFIILTIVLIPFTRLIAGKSWGSTAAIIPLSMAATFFVARLVEQSMKEVDETIVESAICMGTPLRVLVFKVYLKEALPSIMRGIAITLINLVGYSAMAGAIGAGGLGDIAIRFGYQKSRTDVMLVTLALIIVLVQTIQVAFDILAKKIDKR